MEVAVQPLALSQNSSDVPFLKGATAMHASLNVRSCQGPTDPIETTSSPAHTGAERSIKSAAAAAKVVKRFVMPGPLAVLNDQADRLAPRCAHSYGASGAQSRYRIKPATTPKACADSQEAD